MANEKIDAAFIAKLRALPVLPGERLKEWREGAGMTQGEFGAYLAALLGRARAYDRREVSLIERGARVIPEAIQRVYWQMRAEEKFAL